MTPGPLHRISLLALSVVAVLLGFESRTVGALELPQFLRVGLASDLEVVSLPCCQQDLVARSGLGPTSPVVASTSALRVQPGRNVVGSATYRVQVAALKDERQAQHIAREVARLHSVQADAVFDAGTDLYRVRMGRYATREIAEAASARLRAAGTRGSWVVQEGGSMANPELLVSQSGRETVVPGRWLRISNRGGEGIQFQAGRYRGSLLVFLSDRGKLNVINEVSLDDYLRGVVPREMGPDVYDNLEALKAQAVAARTYTLKNMGEFTDEGYDICATPRCQVYSGILAEHPLSDRAVLETSGQVLTYEGELVDALYSSTCGGHTEDVGVIFPLKNEPYLKGVPCVEAGVERLPGYLPRGVAFPAGLMMRLLPPAGPGGRPEVLGARLEHLAILAGLPIPQDRLTALDRREVQRFIASIFDLALDARLFVTPEDLPYLLESPPEDWGAEDLRLAAYLIKSGLLTDQLDQPLTGAEVEETLFRLALYLRVVERSAARHQAVSEGRLEVRVEGETRFYELPADLATFRRVGSRFESGALALVAGDRLELYLKDSNLMAVTHEVDVDGVAFDRTSKFSSWTRFRSDTRLSELVSARFPGFDFHSFSVLERGVSGRVGKIRLTGTDGKTVDVEGLAVRWTLDLPDTLFTAKRLEPTTRPAGWLFSGRGWGHGVGLCQVGGYGMALRGHDYVSILKHYYTGVEITGPATQVASP